MGTCGCSGKKKSMFFSDCGCGCAGKKQEKKFLISVVSALIFFIVANPSTYRLMRRVLGSRIATPNGNPTTLGLTLHSVVYLLIVWKMMNVRKVEEYTMGEDAPPVEEAAEPRPEEEIAVEEPELVPDVPEIGGGDASDDEFEEDVAELPVIEDISPAPVVVPEATVAEYPVLYDPKMINMAIDFDGDLESDDLDIPVTEGFAPMAPVELPNKMRQAGRLEFKALSSFDFDTTDVTPEVSVSQSVDVDMDAVGPAEMEAGIEMEMESSVPVDIM